LKSFFALNYHGRIFRVSKSDLDSEESRVAIAPVEPGVHKAIATGNRWARAAKAFDLIEVNGRNEVD
jgi:hypothetical protein